MFYLIRAFFKCISQFTVQCTLCIPNITKCEINMASFVMLIHIYIHRHLSNLMFAKFCIHNTIQPIFPTNFWQIFSFCGVQWILDTRFTNHNTLNCLIAWKFNEIIESYHSRHFHIYIYTNHWLDFSVNMVFVFEYKHEWMCVL